MGSDVALFIALLMLLGNAFFVGSEFGLVSARRTSIEGLALEGSKRAQLTLGAMENVTVMLAAAQFGITICSLILGAVGEPVVAHLLEEPFGALGLSETAKHLVAFIIAISIMVYLHVVIGEMVPKNLALASPDKTALLLVPALVFLVKFIGPVAIALNNIASFILKLFGIKPQQEIASAFDRDEVEGFIKESHSEGFIDKDEEKLLSGALKFDQKTVQNLVMPLDSLVFAEAGHSAWDIEQLSAKTGFSRFPVRNKKLEITGYIHIKDIIKMNSQTNDDELPKKIIRKLDSAKRSDTLRVALSKMQKNGAHMLGVQNSKGQIDGVVMLEDVLEEIVGDIK